jgi:hypothetical protein
MSTQVSHSEKEHAMQLINFRLWSETFQRPSDSGAM